MNEFNEEVSAQEIKDYCIWAYNPKTGNKGLGYNQTINSTFYRQYLKTIICKDCDIYKKCDNAGEIKLINNHPYQIMFNGVLVYEGGYHSDWMTNIIRRLKGHHEPQDECVFVDIIRKYIPENSIMIELGSFWAYYSLIFKKEIKSSTCYLIEPILDKLKIGKHNFQINDFSGTFINAHISHKRANIFKDWDGEILNIPGITIDDIFNHYKLDRVQVLHADIQGCEVEMLDNCECLKNEKIDFLFIGTHIKNSIVTNKLIKYNYHILLDLEQENTFADDGLVVACCNKFKNISLPPISSQGNRQRKVRRRLRYNNMFRFNR